MKKIVCNIMQALFAFLMFLIAIATIVLDKKVNNIFPNTVSHANVLYYGFALTLLIMLNILSKEKVAVFMDKFYVALMLLIPIAVFGWQLSVSRWMPLRVGSDFQAIMDIAIGLNDGMSFADYPYFLINPNNANLGILLSWIYRVIPNWRGVLLLGAMLTNVSAILSSLTVKNLTKNKYASIVVLIFSEMLMGMTWRAFLVYTDNFGMVFVALSFWIYSKEIKDCYKMPMVIVMAALGGFIKLTALICLLGIMIHYIVFNIHKDKHGPIYVMICAITVICGLLFMENGLRSFYGLSLEGEYPKGWQYMFMVGQNSEYYGVVNGTDGPIRDRYAEEAKTLGESVSYVNEKVLAEGLLRVRERGLAGNFIFYLKKLNVAYNDGYFHNVQPSQFENQQELSGRISYRLLARGGDFYQVSADLFQTIWDAVLVLLMFGSIPACRNDTSELFVICILGITLYLLLFEGRAKYLYMFLPIYICMAGIVFARIQEMTFWRNISKFNRGGQEV